MLQVPDHVRRDPENACDLIKLKLSGFQKLRLLRADGDGRELHTLFQDSHAVAPVRPAIGFLPGLTDLLRILQHARVLKHCSRIRTVGKK